MFSPCNTGSPRSLFLVLQIALFVIGAAGMRISWYFSSLTYFLKDLEKAFRGKKEDTIVPPAIGSLTMRLYMSLPTISLLSCSFLSGRRA